MNYSQYLSSQLVSVVLIMIIFMGCTNTSTQYLLKDLQVSESDRTISVLTIEADNLYNEFPEHIFGALRPSEKNIFDTQILNLLAQYSRSEAYGKIRDQSLNEVKLSLREFQITNHTITMIAPEIGSEIYYADFKNRFVLVLDQFFFTPYQAEVGGDTYAGHENRTEQRMRFELKYLIWDNELKDAVAWGSIERNRPFDTLNQNSSYNVLLSEAIRQIVQMSPFRS